MLPEQETLSGRGIQAESNRVREPRRTALLVVQGLRFYGDGVSSWVVAGQSF